jgi:Domain of Unknown Function (DUF1080)
MFLRRLAVLGIASAALVTPFILHAQQLAQTPPAAGGQPGGSGAPGGGRGAPLVWNFEDHAGFTQIFDGKTLTNWEGSTDIWSVQDSAIVGLSCPDKPAGTTFVFYKAVEPSDFELKVEVKLQNGNSGIQYRSRNVEPPAGGGFPGRGPGGGQAGQPGAGRPGGASGPGGGGGRGPGGAPAEPLPDCANRQAPAPAGLPAGAPQGAAAGAGAAGGPGRGGAYAKWNLQGYQFDYAGRGTGNLWEGGRFAGERGTITNAGQVVLAGPNDTKILLATLGTPEDVNSAIKQNDWNQVHIIVRGYTFMHIINGRLISATVDDDPVKRVAKGVIGFQVEGVNMKVSFRNIWLKQL